MVMLFDSGYRPCLHPDARPPIGLLSRAEIIRAIRLASKNSDDARNQEVLCQLTLGLGLPDHVAQEGETHADFERIFAAMDVDEDKSISFSEFLQYLTRTGVAISKLLDLKRGGVVPTEKQQIFGAVEPTKQIMMTLDASPASSPNHHYHHHHHVAGNNNAHESAAAEDSSNARQEAAVEIMWTRCHDKTHDRFFFHNSRTDETSWIQPNEPYNVESSSGEEEDTSSEEGDEQDASEEDEARREKSNHQAVVWTRCHDRTSDRFYFHNSQTDETSWTEPNEPYSIESSSDDSYEHEDYHEHSEEQQQQASHLNICDMNTGKTDEKTPVPWTRRYDKSSGSFYYHNSQTDKTSWTQPHAPYDIESSSGESMTSDGEVE